MGQLSHFRDFKEAGGFVRINNFFYRLIEKSSVAEGEERIHTHG